jgi:hypothetical protein
MLETVEILKMYMNKKTKNIYLVLDFVKHSETLEDMVLYSRASGNDDTHWVRPLELFKEKFEEI